MNKFYILVVVSIFFCTNIFAQEPSTFLPPSPQAFQLAKYGNTTVNLASGAISPQIDLYQLNSGSISLPVQLNYAYSGFKPSESYGFLGRGWQLNCGGVITRAVNGAPDEGYVGDDSKGFFRFGGNLTETITDQVARQIISTTPAYDSQPDQFFFRFGNYSGSFFWGNDGQFHLENQAKWKISHQIGTTDIGNLTNALTSITITTENGTRFIFSDKEYSNNDARLQGPIWTVSAWYLSKIIDPNGYTINFTYNTIDLTKSRLQRSFSESGYDIVYGGQLIKSIFQQDDLLSGNQSKYLTQVTGSDWKLKFLYSDSQVTMDVNGTLVNGSNSYIDYFKSLDKIELYATNGPEQLTNYYNFQYNSTKKSLLKSTQFVGASGVPQNPYQFEYDNEGFDANNLTDGMRKSVDYWGFYNGSNNAYLLPSRGSNRNPSFTYTSIFSLKKITYPTKGYTTFEYEGNEGTYKIAKNDTSYVTDTHYFSWEKAGNQWSSVDENPVTVSENNTNFSISLLFQGENMSDYIPTSCTFSNVPIPISTNTYGATFFKNYGCFYNAPSEATFLHMNVEVRQQLITSSVGYASGKVGGIRIKTVKDYFSDNLVQTKSYSYQSFSNANVSSGYALSNFSTVLNVTNNTDLLGRFFYSSPINVFALSPIIYSNVTEQVNNSFQNKYVFSNYNETSTNPILDNLGDNYGLGSGCQAFLPDGGFGPGDSFAYLRAQPITNTYLNQGQIALKDSSSYLNKSSLLQESIAYQTVAYFYKPLFTIPATPKIAATTCYFFKKYHLSSTFPRLVYKEHSLYGTNGGAAQTQKTELGYGLNHLQPNLQRVYQSDGSYLETQTTYPLDYNTTGGLDPTLQKMIDSNRVAYALEQKTYHVKNGTRTLVDASLNTYQDVAGNSLRPRLYLPFIQYRFNRYLTPTTYVNYAGTSNQVSNGNYKESLRFTAYTAKGRPLEIKEHENVLYSLLWGKEDEKLLGFVKGSSYSNLQNALQSAGLSLVSLQNNSDENNLQQQLGSLRTQTALSGSLAQFFVQHPIFGTTWSQAANGQVQRFVYDDFGRLTWQKNHFGQVVQGFGYYLSGDGQTRLLGGISGEKNAVLTARFTRDGGDASTLSNESYARSMVQYVDGLGNLLQQLSYRFTPQSKDLVLHTEYDAFARPYKQTKPIPLASNAGTYEANPYPQAQSSYGDSRAFTEVTAYENSVLSRPLTQYLPGAAWYSNQKAQQFSYTVVGTEVPFYEIDASMNLNRTGSYLANSLFKTCVTNEQGQMTCTIKDLQERTIQQIDALGNVTHYVYYKDGLLGAVIQPKGYALNSSISYNSADFRGSVFFYQYDNQKRLVANHVPGGGLREIVYDKFNRIVLLRSGAQSISGQWTFIKYDALGRMVLVGEITDTRSRTDFQSVADASSLQAYESRSGNGNTYYTLSQSFPQVAEADVRHLNYYDDYNNWKDASLNFDRGNAFYDSFTTQGLLTGSKTRYTENSNWLSSAWYYDALGRKIQTQEQNLWGKVEREEFQYNLVGEQLQRRRKFVDSTGSTITLALQNTLDHAGRVTNTYLSVNGGANEEIYRFAYDEVGRLSTKAVQPGSFSVGGTADVIDLNSPQNSGQVIAKRLIRLNPGFTFDAKQGGSLSLFLSPNATSGTPLDALQKVQYSWHIRGGLLGINLDGNGNTALNAAEADLFSYKLAYEGAGQWAGNIASTQWSHQDGQRSYQYQYTSANQISGGTYSGINGENFSVSNMSYDRNGNIMSLNRSGKNGNGYSAIDQLNYSYSGNQLINIVDGVSGNEDVGDFRDAGTSTDYTYYADGSLKSDANKGISLIQYDTFLNRIKQVNFSDGGWMKFFYKSNGELIKRLSSTGESRSYSSGGAYWLNGKGYQIDLPEGRLVNNNGTWEKQFYYQDHLGSNRVTFRANSGKLEVVEKQDYDVLGQSTMSYSAPNSVENLFRFQNKEKIKELGLTNFGARLYDQNSGLFKQVDELGNFNPSWSPFVAMGNNFANYVDLFGLDTLSSKDKNFAWSNVKPGDVLDGSNVLDEVVVTPNQNNRICGNCLDPSSIGNNLLGLSYPGGNNPTSFNRHYNYSYVPKNMAEFPAIGHDRRYDNLKIKGLAGLLVNKRAIGADWRFVSEELSIANNQYLNPIDRLASGVLGVGLGLIVLPKTLFQLSTPEGYSEIKIWYDFSNQGVNNKPVRHQH